jgi:WD40 repeat protein
MIPGRDHWLVLDAAGALWHLDSKLKAQRTLEFHAGPLAGVVCSNAAHVAATLGADGSLRLNDFVKHQTLATMRFNAAGTALCGLPRELDLTGGLFVAGFADGVVRVLQRCSDGIQMINAFKSHSGRVSQVAVSVTGLAAVGGHDGTIFFVQLDPFTPIGFVSLGSPITSISWSMSGTHLVASTEAGRVVRMDRPHVEQFDTTATFEITPATADLVYPGAKDVPVRLYLDSLSLFCC